MDIEGVTTLIINQGFAVAVAIYSLTRLEKTMKDNTSALMQLAKEIGGNHNDNG
jgi:hypothetical protein